MAPEKYQGFFTAKSDVWSVGVICWDMLAALGQKNLPPQPEPPAGNVADSVYGLELLEWTAGARLALGKVGGPLARLALLCLAGEAARVSLAGLQRSVRGEVRGRSTVAAA